MTHIINHRLNQSFARRIGKTLSRSNKALLENDLPDHLFDVSKINNLRYKKIFVEIGFGMGEHLLRQMISNPNYLYIGVEVYLNGVAHFMQHAIQNQCKNFMIWVDDVDLILRDISPKSIDGVYILFPDPWHKRRQLKKRLFNAVRLKYFVDIIKNNGTLFFASDIADYFHVVHDLINDNCNLHIIQNDFTTPHAGYVMTKYHKKALLEDRISQFLSAIVQW